MINVKLGKTLLLSAVGLGGFTSAGAAPIKKMPELTIQIENLKSADGVVLVSVYDRASEFPRADGKAVQIARVPAKVGKVEVKVQNLKPGEYAVAVFHDANGNGKLDTNFLGIPREGFGFSNDAMKTFGPPDFGQAKFHFAEAQTLTIRLKHF